MKWSISLVVTSNHKCLNKVVSNITIDFNYFRARTWPPRWYIYKIFSKFSTVSVSLTILYHFASEFKNSGNVGIGFIVLCILFDNFSSQGIDIFNMCTME